MAANVSFAIGVVLTKRFPAPSNRLAATGWQLLMGGVILVPLSAFLEGAPPALTGRNLAGGLARLRSLGIRCLLVEGGSRVITSALREQLADRVVVAVAPILLGKGTDAVGDLGASLVRDGLRLLNRTVHQLEQDLVVAGDLDWAGG